MSSIRFTWSRMATNPVEHIADQTEFENPLCSTRLRSETKMVGDAASGRVPICSRCVKRMLQFKRLRSGFYKNNFFQVEVVFQPRSIGAGRFVSDWVVRRASISDGGSSQISTHDARGKALAAAAEHLKTFWGVKAMLESVEKMKATRLPDSGEEQE